ncbi:MAG: aspartate kinase, partial [Bacteroidota bacterium]|nr:aspartate kinase [Bacteroidota bacterium]
NQDGKSVTLGREGSDYTASILAYALDAAEVVFWKDVPGLMNADPKDFSDARKLDQISYWEAIELSYYGAKVIHPKTIKPLQNKIIPLKVKSFINPADDGSLIFHETSGDARIPSYIIKDDQVLISFSPKDLSFIAEEILHYIIGIFIKYKVSINLMQTSAITFSVCVDNGDNISKIIKELEGRYNIKFNKGLVLITIRHYTTEAIQEMVKDKTILLEQRSRSTVQYVVKET